MASVSVTQVAARRKNIACWQQIPFKPLKIYIYIYIYILLSGSGQGGCGREEVTDARQGWACIRKMMQVGVGFGDLQPSEPQ